MMKEITKNDNNTREERVLVPLSDIYETADQYTLKLEMPGVTREKLEITMENDELEIRGSVAPYKPENKELMYSEFSQYDYFRRFTVGNDIDRDKVSAVFEDGVLTLVLQKHESVKPRKIAINVH
ncbi:MAG: Hsp20/alpha crystallin family protein [Spirochaetes bacterium]|nr:Hsp20/alpha crystallin family protein [Spirochaetota bacterium]